MIEVKFVSLSLLIQQIGLYCLLPMFVLGFIWKLANPSEDDIPNDFAHKSITYSMQENSDEFHQKMAAWANAERRKQ